MHAALKQEVHVEKCVSAGRIDTGAAPSQSFKAGESERSEKAGGKRRNEEVVQNKLQIQQIRLNEAEHR